MNFIRLFFVLCLVVSCNGCTHQEAQEKGTDSAILSPTARDISPSSNPGTITIEDPSIYNEIVAISDTHGMYEQVASLLLTAHIIDENKNWVAGPTLLVIIGDSLDKGSQSIELLDLWIQLQKQAESAQGKVIHLLGNHEVEFLANPLGDKKDKILLDELKIKNIPLSDLTSSLTIRGRFLHDEPLAAKIGKWLFTHSGFFPDTNWEKFTLKAKKYLNEQNYNHHFLLGNKSILEAKDWEKHKVTRNEELQRMDHLGVFGQIFGHQPEAFHVVGRSAAKYGGRLIKIDNGMPPEGGSHRGSILKIIHPSQLSESRFPEIVIIEADGKNHPLLIE